MDENIRTIVHKIKHILKNHRKITEEQGKHVDEWLERFLTNDDKDKSNILNYAKYLEYQLKYKFTVTFPFDQAPPKEIVPLSKLSNELFTHYHEDLKQGKGSIDEANLAACTKIINEAEKNDLCLTEFLTKISPHSEDRGEIIREIAQADSREFQDLIGRIFTDRNLQTDKILSSKQFITKSKYAIMEKQMLNRSKIAQNFLKDLLPGFNYADYLTDKNYIRKILQQVDQNNTNKKPADMNCMRGEDYIKQQQFKLKFLEDEMRRKEEENEELIDAHNNLMSQLNQMIKQQQGKPKELITRNKMLKEKLVALNITSDENRKIIESELLTNFKKR